MPSQTFTLPEFRPDMGSSQTFALEGMIDISQLDGQGGQYRIHPVIGTESLQTGLDPSITRLFASRSLDIQITLALTETKSLLLQSGEFVELVTEDPEILKKSFPVEFSNGLYSVYSNGAIYRNRLSGIEKLTGSTLAARMAELGVGTQPVTDTANWLGRVWVTAGDQLMGNDPRDIEQWNPTAQLGDGSLARNVRTSAISTQLPVDRILGLEPLARRLFLFGTDSVHDIQTTNIDTSIHITEFLRNINYRGGAVNYKDGLYFLEEEGVRVIGLDGSTEIISRNIDLKYQTFIRNTQPETITQTVVGDTIFWSNRTSILTYNTKWRRFGSMISTPNVVFGDYRTPGTTVDQLVGTIDSIGQEINQLSSNSLNLPAAIVQNELKGFTFPVEKKICFQLLRNSNNQRVMLRSFTVPELTNYSIEVRETGSNDWGPKYTPNKWNTIKISRPFKSPEIRIQTDDIFDQLNNYVAEFKVYNAG